MNGYATLRHSSTTITQKDDWSVAENTRAKSVLGVRDNEEQGMDSKKQGKTHVGQETNLDQQVS